MGSQALGLNSINDLNSLAELLSPEVHIKIRGKEKPREKN
jgi:hypothetical protein